MRKYLWLGVAVAVIGCAGSGTPGGTGTVSGGPTGTTTTGTNTTGTNTTGTNTTGTNTGGSTGSNAFAGTYSGSSEGWFFNSGNWELNYTRPATGSVDSSGSFSFVSIRSDGRNTIVSGQLSSTGQITSGTVRYWTVSNTYNTVGIINPTFTPPSTWQVDYNPGSVPGRIRFTLFKQ